MRERLGTQGRCALAFAAAALIAGCGGGKGEATSRAAPPAARPATAATPTPTPRPRIVRGRHDEPVPVLMYHVIKRPAPGTRYAELWVPAEDFAAHMRLLAAHGYHGVTLDQVLDYWQRGYALPRKPIVVSFDDGYFSQYRSAAPVLKRLGWPGVLNLAVQHLGEAGGLNRTQVERLIADGWEIDAHTINHVDLTAVSAAQLRREVAGSRRILRRAFGVPVDAFCYPSGRYNATVEAAVRAAGYRAATTTELGLARAHGDPFALARIRVNGGENAATVLARVQGLGA